MTRPGWLRLAVTNRHRHVIEQASRRWRGGRRDGSARTRRKILISTQVNSPFERDSSSAGLTRLRRDAIAYIDVKLSGAGDASAGQDPAAGMSAAWAAARAANATDEDEDGGKDKFGARGAKKREVGKIESDSEKEEKAKFASRKSGTRPPKTQIDHSYSPS